MGWVVLMAVLGWSMPARADDDADMLKQAEDLVHQAWNPGGDPPPKDQQEDLLQKAINLAVRAPQHRVHGHRVHAIQLMRGALDLIKNGDPEDKAPGLLRDADSELREAISEAT
jgi:hypothetical protein